MTTTTTNGAVNVEATDEQFDEGVFSGEEGDNNEEEGGDSEEEGDDSEHEWSNVRVNFAFFSCLNPSSGVPHF